MDEQDLIKADLHHRLQQKIDGKTKPPGALGMLEKIALQAGLVFNTLTPEIRDPQIVVFAADHGIAAEGVSAYPAEVTPQMVLNFVRGGAAINVFCRQHGIGLTVVDAGVDFDFDPALPIVPHKIAKGTRSFLHGPAMEPAQVQECLRQGRSIVQDLSGRGCNTIGFGEMGIGNTSTAAVLMSQLCDIPVEDCVGRGTGVTDHQLLHKQQVLRRSIENYSGGSGPEELMAYFGGFEIVQMAGAMLEATENRMLILIDGFIASVAYLCAFKLDPAVRQNAVFCHQSEEQGHRQLLSFLGAQPLLQLGMRLGEGTGCAVALPLLKSALAFLEEMASFESAGVSNKEI